MVVKFRDEAEPIARAIFAAQYAAGEWDAAVAEGSWRVDEASTAAEALWREGWRPCPEIADLDALLALPVQSVVGFVRQGLYMVMQRGTSGWLLPGDDSYVDPRVLPIPYPVRLLHTPAD